MISKATFDLLKRMPPFIRELRIANRENRKTQTRRVIKPQPVLDPDSSWRIEMKPRSGYSRESVMRSHLPWRCPYGETDDIRYMREPLYRGSGDRARYLDDNQEVKSLLTGEPILWKWKKDVLSQLYMPKEAARTFKRYEFVRVERLQEISEEDAIVEGMYKTNNGFKSYVNMADFRSAREAFVVLWYAINSERGYPWSGNWWVWVIGYSTLTLPSPEGRGEEPS